jgi:hypothetical protein
VYRSVIQPRLAHPEERCKKGCLSAPIRHARRQPHDFAPKAALYGIAVIAFLASVSVALPSAAQSGNGGTGGSLTAAGGSGGGGTGGSGGGGSGGTGGSAAGGVGGSSMTGAGGSLDDPGASCTSASPEECPDRCPMFATCSVGSSEQGVRLYYRVDDQRFDCDGLNCAAALAELGDYCCERGKFAPSDDDGGCALPGAGAGEGSDGTAWLSVGFGLCAAGFGLVRRRRARSH